MRGSIIQRLELTDLGKVSYSVVARGVSREKLFEWYTDYSPEDVDIIKRRSSGRLVSRTCTRDGNKLHVVTVARGFRKPTTMTADAVLHPEDYSYDIHTSGLGLVDDRHYTFTQCPEGTRISVESHYRATNRLMKFLVVIGLMRLLSPSMNKSTTKAFIAEAEEQLGSKESNKQS